MLAINATGNPYVLCSTYVLQCVQRQVHACAAAHWSAVQGAQAGGVCTSRQYIIWPRS
jgi:hypothetical protein